MVENVSSKFCLLIQEVFPKYFPCIYNGQSHFYCFFLFGKIHQNMKGKSQLSMQTEERMIIIWIGIYFIFLQAKGKSDNYWIVGVHENPQQLR